MKSLRHHLLSDQKHPSRPLLVWPPLPSLKLARLKFKKQRESYKSSETYSSPASMEDHTSRYIRTYV